MGKERGKHRSAAVIRLIGVFRLLKAILLLAAGFGVLNYMNQDLASRIRRWLEYWHVDPDSHYFHAAVSKIARIDNHKMAIMAGATFLYAGLFGTEGIGLLLRKRWAEYLSAIATASFIPLEIYHLTRHFSLVRIVVIVINAIIVAYLVWRLKSER